LDLAQLFFVTRYWFGLSKASIFSLIMIVANEIVIFSLDVIDFMATGKYRVTKSSSS